MESVLNVVSKGVSVITTLLQTGEDAMPAVKALADLVSGHQTSDPTQEDLDKCEEALDALIDEFNLPLPTDDA